MEERRVSGEIVRTPYNSVLRRIHPMALPALALAAIGLGLLMMMLRNSGNFLVVDNREKSDAILITQGESLDASYWVGIQLLKAGYGRLLFLDARSDRMWFGRTQADRATDYIAETAGKFANQVKVCPIDVGTTAEEIYVAGKCLKAHQVHSVLLVVSDFHCRRSLAIFSRLHPRYHRSIAGVEDPMRFGWHWWQKREWIRTAIVEWQHLLWWELIDRWRFAPSTLPGSV